MLKKQILTDPKYYEIRLESSESIIRLLAISYQIEAFGEYYSIQYYLIYSNIDLYPEFDKDNCLTFLSEILTKNAYSYYKGKREDENNHIKQILINKLGDRYRITIEEIRLPKRIN